MTITIDEYDISSLVSDTGFQINRVKRASSEDMKTIEGVLYPSYGRNIAVLSIPLVPLTTQQYNQLWSKLRKTSVNLGYKDPYYGQRTITAKPSDITSQLVLEIIDGTEYWDGFVLGFEEC